MSWSGDPVYPDAPQASEVHGKEARQSAAFNAESRSRKSSFKSASVGALARVARSQRRNSPLLSHVTRARSATGMRAPESGIGALLVRKMGCGRPAFPKQHVGLHHRSLYRAPATAKRWPRARRRARLRRATAPPLRAHGQRRRRIVLLLPVRSLPATAYSRRRERAHPGHEPPSKRDAVQNVGSTAGGAGRVVRVRFALRLSIFDAVGDAIRVEAIGLHAHDLVPQPHLPGDPRDPPRRAVDR